MDEFAWLLALVAQNGRLGFQGFEPAETQAAQHVAHCRARHGEAIGYGLAGEALAAQNLDGCDSLGGELMLRPGWRRAPVS